MIFLSDHLFLGQDCVLRHWLFCFSSVRRCLYSIAFIPATESNMLVSAAPKNIRWTHFWLMGETITLRKKWRGTIQALGGLVYLQWTREQHLVKPWNHDPSNRRIQSSTKGGFSQWKLWQLANVTCGGKHSLLTVRHNLCLEFRFNVWLSTYSDLRSQYITTNR